ncbi:peptidase family M48 family [Trichomonas vaginalis G3]|uniref:peptidase family M48 family n=1 Tax=Trichomonas vaginalis (strain ATCC PRA-98 / G3) TaxID=412133 RepID=UPI0021E5FF58|nr:peptidase family M48 family [Trichomonas vaginalis G3]KAI5517812.1 peptidase family M48 family [Trichomonas vaginalis G3]
MHYLDRVFPRKYTFKPYNYYIPRYPVVDTVSGNILYYSVISIFLYFLIEVTQIIPITQALKRKKIESRLLNHYDKDDELLKTSSWYPFVKYIFFFLIILAWTQGSRIVTLKTVNDDDFWLFFPYNNKNVTRFLRKPLKVANFKITSIGMLIGDQGKSVNAFIQSDGAIYLTQQLIEVMSEREIAASVAHELGHYYFRDMLYFSFFWTIPVLLFIFILYSLMKNGLEEFGFEKELPIVPIIFITFAFSESFFNVIRIASNILNRVCEIRADCFAASFDLPITTAIQKLTSDQERLDIKSIELYHFFFRTHPRGLNRDDIFAHCPKFPTKLFD